MNIDEWSQKMHQIFPDYKIWRISDSLNFMPFEIYRSTNGNKIIFDKCIIIYFYLYSN